MSVSPSTKSAVPNKSVEWLVTSAGIACASCFYTLTIFIATLYFGDNPVGWAQVEKLFPWLFGVSVPAGAALGILVTIIIANKKNSFKITSQILIGSWLMSSVIGYPVSLVWLGLFAFGMPGAEGAAIMAGLLLFGAFCCCGLIGLLMKN